LLSTPIFTDGTKVVSATRQRAKGYVNEDHADKTKDGHQNEPHWVVARSRPTKTCDPGVHIGMTSKRYRKWLGGAPVRVAPIREGAGTRTLTSVTSQSKVRACPAGRYQKQGDVIGNVVNVIHSERVTRISSSIKGEILQ
jgi:hypothetical protein